MLGKVRDKYQTYCAAYKTDTMTTCHGATGHTDIGRNLHSHIDITTKGDTGGIDIGHDNNNESTNSSDILSAFGGSEVDGLFSNLLHSSQANLRVLTRNINSL